MTDRTEHEARVAEWAKHAVDGVPAPRQAELLETALMLLWARSERTLGGITLGAIVDRVLSGAVERYPVLAVLSVDATGVRCGPLRLQAIDFGDQVLREAAPFVLVEFLTVLGDLTADILTPALHRELASAAPAPEPVPRGRAKRKKKAKR